MPILDEEPDTYPPHLFDPLEPAADGPARVWWVAHTRPRQEKAIARELLKIGLPYYLPCQKRRTKVGGRVVPVKIPLFAGYVFVRAADPEKWRVLATKRVAQLLPVADQDRLWADLRRVRGVLDLGRPVTPEIGLRPGDTVTLRDGPLAGMTGTIEKVAGGFKFIVRVDFIRQGVSVQVDGEWLGVTA
jgi:transcriptional antiterminator RfaH